MYNNYLKCFITSDDIVKYEEKYNLLVLPYKLKDCLFNLINNYYNVEFEDKSLNQSLKKINLNYNLKPDTTIYNKIKKFNDYEQKYEVGKIELNKKLENKEIRAFWKKNGH